ncbi:Serine/threonine-protein kinase PknB [Stieleria bergensis]|uniref:Serine/threonine-protein kinase PknB n=1 Tax=Stieleria bergensis TaxID=2528025 RepID=A0A517STG5_9BACT|nr:Serine/threonine-protein kinase PknB [Planctomycetes bacterium SV_7m_r]
MSVEDETQLAELLDLWESKYEEGTDVSVAELAANYPQLKETLEKRIKALKATAWLNEPVEKEDTRQCPEDYGLPEKLGRYELQSLIGSGGFGQVWKAFDSELHRSVAIKVPHPDRIGSDQDAERFVQEARRVAQLSHVGIVPVHDVGRQNNVVFIVSEFIDGKSLLELLHEGSASEEKAVNIVRSVALALDHAHEKGFIHRDIKPANILIANDGTPKLADFGISISTDDESNQLGTLAFMPPEQLRGEKVDSRSDIYSLGAVLCQLLTGKLPRTETTPSQLRQSFSDDPVATIPGSVASSLRGVLAKSLHVDPSQRFSSASEFAEALSKKKQSGLFGVSIVTGLVLLAALGGLLPQLWPDKSTSNQPDEITSRPDEIEGVDKSEYPVGIELLTQHESAIVSLTALQDGRVVSTDGFTVSISSQADTAKQIDTDSNATCLSEIGENVAIGTESGAIELWDVASGIPTKAETLTSLVSPVTAIAGNADYIVAASDNGEVVVYIMTTESAIAVRLHAAPGRVQSIQFTDQNEFSILIGSNGEQPATFRSYRFDSSSGELHPTSNTPLDQAANVTSMAFSDDGQYLTAACRSRGVAVWRLTDDGQRLMAEGEFAKHTANVTSLSFVDGQHMVSADADGRLRFWSISDQREIDRVFGLKPVTVTTVSGGTVFIGTEDGEIFSWKVAEPVTTSEPEPGSLRLFDGKSFAGWKLGEGCKFPLHEAASIQPDGVLRVHHKPEMKRNDSVLWYESEFDDFRLRLQWRQLDKTKEVGKGTGVLVRANRLKTGIEVGIGSVVATGAFFVPKSCRLDTPPEKVSPHVSEMRWAKKYTSRPVGEWNHMTIVCERDTITVECNGVMVNRGENCSERLGRIGILLQGSEYEFRNVEITPHAESEN